MKNLIALLLLALPFCAYDPAIAAPIFDSLTLENSCTLEYATPSQILVTDSSSNLISSGISSSYISGLSSNIQTQLNGKELLSNKATDLTSPDNTKYPTTLAVSNAIAAIPTATPPVTSVFSRTGAVTAQSGDYTTTQVTEGTNLYFTNTRAQNAISNSSPITYSTGVIGCQSASGSQAGCLSSTDWSTFNNKQASGNYITSLTGDVTGSGPGATSTTLATVNSSPGSYGSASSTLEVVVNGKGLLTSATPVPIQIAESQVTNLVSDLAGKQPIGNYITALSGDGVAMGPGSTTFTLSTVNTNVGSFSPMAATVNGKGLITAASSITTGNFTDAGTDGITVTSGTGAVLGSGTSIAQHVADTSHSGYLLDTDWNTFNGKQASGNYITALTGDATASGPGSSAITFATVNSSPGSFTNANVTVNAKGLVTSVSNGSGGGVTSVSNSDGTLVISPTTGSVVASRSGIVGDVSIPAGSTVATLATVNSNVGSFSPMAATVNGKGLVTAASNVATGNLTDVGTDGITIGTGTGAVLGSGTTISQQVATSSTNGYLASADWSTFNSKQSALTFSTGLTNTSGTITSNLSTGVSGGQTAIGGTLSGNSLTLSSTSNSTKGQIISDSQHTWTTGLGAINQIAGPTDQPLAIISSAPTVAATSTAGNALNITSSNATAGNVTAGAAAGAAINITTGNAAQLTSGNAAGGALTLVTGTGIGTTGTGAVSVTSGASSTTTSGSATFGSGSATTGGTGAVTISSGTVSGNGAGSGAINITSGNTAGNTLPGTVAIKSGNATDTISSTAGGQITITTGNGASNSLSTAGSTAGKAGDLTLTGSNGGIESGNGSLVTLTGGGGANAGITSGNGGNATGAGTSSTIVGGAAGAVTITSGNGGSSTSGGAGTHNGGNAGNINLVLGTAGTGATVNGVAGSFIVTQTLSGSDATPTHQINPIWNTSAIPTALKISVTNTSSGTGAKLIDAQVGGTSQFNIDKLGNATANLSVSINGGSSGTITQKAGNTTASYAVLWPSAQGAASTSLVNDGSGNLSWSSNKAPTLQKFLSTGTPTGYFFTVNSANATVGATYTNNGNTFTVLSTIAAATQLFTSGASAPTSTGTLTKSGGTGDATITFTVEQPLATYTTPTSPAPLYIEIETVGGGAGGSGSNGGSATAGNGQASVFGTALLIANGGLASTSGYQGGVGGTASIASGPIGLALTGGGGQSATEGDTQSGGGTGGSSALGGAGSGGSQGSGGTGIAGAANTGGGGGGGSGATLDSSGPGGGSGGYVRAMITSSVAPTYFYSVGLGGTAGTSAQSNGAAGGTGVLIVREHYQ